MQQLMQHTYVAELRFIHAIVQAHRGNYKVEAFLSLRGIQGLCRVRLTLLSGTIVSCEITNGQQTITGEEALHLLQATSKAEWTVEPLQTASTLPEPPPVVLTSIPTLLRQIDRQTMSRWSHRKRRVFILINGMRPINSIATLVSKESPANVVEIVDELRREGLVTI